VTPRPERPGLHPSYGISTDEEGLLPWSWVSEQMEGSRNYWVGTTRPDGRPHAMPVWGVWLEDTLFFSTGDGSVKARNLAADPRVAVHLESGDEAVMLEGTAERASLDPDVHGRVVAAYGAKYDMTPDDLPGREGWYILRPAVVFAWQERDFPRTATRWRFD
jgi:PPOX class probable F420-dependent enzyme